MGGGDSTQLDTSILANKKPNIRNWLFFVLLANRSHTGPQTLNIIANTHT